MVFVFNNDNETSIEKNKKLEQLYAKYAKLMFHVAFEILHDRYLAEDAVQTVFIKLEKNNFRIDSISCNKTKSFMVIITRNIAISIYNSRQKEATAYDYKELEEIPDDRMLPLDIVVSNESILDIQNSLSLLNSKYSDILLMKYFSDYTNTEIASLFNISEELVRVRLHRAKKLLKIKMNEGDKSNG